MIGRGGIHCRALVTVAAGAIVMAGLAGANTVGLRFNATPSMPVGFWQMMSNPAQIRRGEVVVLCPPDTASLRMGQERGYIPSGNCPGGSEPLVKPIAAVGGDVVAVSATGVVVNGRPVPDTAQLSRDSAGRPLMPIPAGVYAVAPGEMWLLSGHDPRSFDSRYFGPVPQANVQGVARPLLVLR
ncbi:MAG: conjugative transfer signal peptidase TraF [Rhodospirillales bacterium]|nr:conjugative transfer signal peptidase TraF [Rhodospirillales bacterium]